jgi:hypothetical protein
LVKLHLDRFKKDCYKTAGCASSGSKFDSRYLAAGSTFQHMAQEKVENAIKVCTDFIGRFSSPIVGNVI